MTLASWLDLRRCVMNCLWGFWLFAGLSGGSVGHAALVGSAVRDYESPHFLLHTDLPEPAARGALARLESTLLFAVRHWKRPAQGRIECFLVDELANWPSGSLPHPHAKVLVGGVGGATLSRISKSSDPHHYQAIVYASAKPGIAEHEVIHAYCAQNFGATGPNWYKEGMAELAMFGEDGINGVRCPEERLANLRRQPNHPLHAVFNSGKFSQRIGDSLDAMPLPASGDRQIPLDAWTAADDENVRQAREEYLWGWALCHLLAHNPNFSTRFQKLGEEYLTNRKATFHDQFAVMNSEIQFEYRFFLEHVKVGYRADLCYWDWSAVSDPSQSPRGKKSRVLAARGWQATGLCLPANSRLQYRVSGTWSTGGSNSLTDADGDLEGGGRLVAIIMTDYQLSAEIPLGTCGELVTPTSGKLFLRCRDDWNSIGDNFGEVQVQWDLFP